MSSPVWSFANKDCGCKNYMDGRLEYCSIHSAAPDLLAALKAADEWIRENTQAMNRPARLDQQIMNAIAKAQPVK